MSNEKPEPEAGPANTELAEALVDIERKERAFERRLAVSVALSNCVAGFAALAAICVAVAQCTLSKGQLKVMQTQMQSASDDSMKVHVSTLRMLSDLEA